MNCVGDHHRARLGHSFQPGGDVHPVAEDVLVLVHDITDMDAIRKMVKENDVKAIVNCAAWTNVDACETDM